MVRYQLVGTMRYFDVAGYPGRILGLPADEAGDASRDLPAVDKRSSRTEARLLIGGCRVIEETSEMFAGATLASRRTKQKP
ncbi:hypothetical protein [Muricoccus aerilatus]|uniref:hypothetical protein n=1 Tax=Muricoccus aerilatus TaxID=452982 RepID=UPI0005C1D013|nr:hypothetical protein [Roseomonas aerilata]